MRRTKEVMLNGANGVIVEDNVIYTENSWSIIAIINLYPQLM